jgi:hypothetical protein
VLDLPPCQLKVPATLDSSSRLAAVESAPWPTTKLRAGGEVDLSRIPGPSARSQDLAFLHGFKEGWYALRSQSRGVGFGLAWDPKVFSWLWYWQLYRGGADYPWWGNEYVTAIEPVTSMATRFADAIANGTAYKVAGGAKVSTELTAWAFEGAGPVFRVTREGVETGT